MKAAMRPLEILICILLAGSSWVVIRSQIRREHIMRILFLTVLLCLFHLSAEGYRWQMVPAFGLLGYLFIRTKLIKRIKTRLMGGPMLVVWLIISAALPLAIPVPKFDPLSGPFDVGTQTFQWSDSARAEWFTDEDPDDLRKLVVQVWYPAIDNNEESPPYMDHMDQRMDALAKAGGFSGVLVEQIGLAETRSLLNAEPAQHNQKWPLLIFSHGITGQRALHTLLFEHLASYGYFVAAPDHPYDCNLTVFPDGSIADYRSDITGHPDSASIRRMQLNTRVADIRFIADRVLMLNEAGNRFENMLNKNMMAVAGHSYGGATAIQSSFEDERFKVCIALDGWMNPLPSYVVQQGIDQPFLHLSRPHWKNNSLTHLRLDSLLAADQEMQFSYIVDQTEHLDYTDIPLLNPLSDYFLDTGPIAAGRAVNLVHDMVLSFLDQYLQKSQNGFHQVQMQYQEIKYKDSHLK